VVLSSFQRLFFASYIAKSRRCLGPTPTHNPQPFLWPVLVLPGRREITSTMNEPQDADFVFFYPVDKTIVVNEDLADIVALELGDDTPSLGKKAQRASRFQSTEDKG